MSVAPFILRKVYVYGRKVHEIAILQECGAVFLDDRQRRGVGEDFGIHIVVTHSACD